MPDNKSGLTFAKEVGTDSEGQLEYEVQGNILTIHTLDVFVYGNETLLKLRPVVQPVNNSSRIPLVETIGNAELDGHHAEYNWTLNEELTEGDRIIIEYDNQDTQNPHRFRINMDVTEDEPLGGVFS